MKRAFDYTNTHLNSRETDPLIHFLAKFVKIFRANFIRLPKFSFYAVLRDLSFIDFTVYLLIRARLPTAKIGYDLQAEESLVQGIYKNWGLRGGRGVDY